MPDRETAEKIAYYKKLAGPFGIGLAVIAVAIAGVFWMQRGAHLELKGSILKVRTAPMDEASAVTIIDFRFVNSSDVPFVVRQVDVTMVGADGQTYSGSTVSEVDAKRLLEFYPSLGPKYNESLVLRNKIPPHASEDRMIAARFELPAAKLETRKGFTVRIEDVDGPVSELVEGPKK